LRSATQGESPYEKKGGREFQLMIEWGMMVVAVVEFGPDS
jgi:hypothetical protein